jgi:carbon monoxide dehydrogenase subunit G
MSISVDIDLGHEFAVAAPFDDVFDVLSDVRASVGHFPKVHRLVELAPDAWRWEMERISVGTLSVQTVYACRYTTDRAHGSVVWTPIAGVGNAQVGGSWAVAAREPGTRLAFKVHGVLDLPLPAMMTLLITPIVRSEFTGLIDTYLDNLRQRFGRAA